MNLTHALSSSHLKPIIKSACVLSVISISNFACAERNPNIYEACAQFKVAAAQSPTDEVTFKYSNAPGNNIYTTYYKGVGSEYHTTPEDRKTKKLTLLPRDDIYTSPFKNISMQEYHEFFRTCGLRAEEDLIPLGVVLIETGFDPVVAAKALEDSEWFEIVHPMFIIKPLTH